MTTRHDGLWAGLFFTSLVFCTILVGNCASVRVPVVQHVADPPPLAICPDTVERGLTAEYVRDGLAPWEGLCYPGRHVYYAACDDLCVFDDVDDQGEPLRSTWRCEIGAMAITTRPNVKDTFERTYLRDDGTGAITLPRARAATTLPHALGHSYGLGDAETVIGLPPRRGLLMNHLASRQGWGMEGAPCRCEAPQTCEM